MLANIAIGCLLVVLTTCIHTTAMVVALRTLKIFLPGRWAKTSAWTRESTIAAVVLMMSLAALLESALWAAAYLLLGAISGLEQTLYFSLVTFTTLGYGDVTLDEQWRLLASFQAANGTIMFGWTTAVIVGVVQRVYGAEAKAIEQHA